MLKTLAGFLGKNIEIKLVDNSSHKGKIKHVSSNLLVLEPNLYVVLDKIVYFRPVG